MSQLQDSSSTCHRLVFAPTNAPADDVHGMSQPLSEVVEEIAGLQEHGIGGLPAIVRAPGP